MKLSASSINMSASAITRSRFLQIAKTGSIIKRCFCSQQVSVSVDDHRVQELLYQLNVSDIDLDQVLERRKEPLVVPQYKLMSLDELKQAHTEAMETAKQLLKLPPILPLRKSKGHMLSVDEEMVGATQHKMIFTETSQHQDNENRRIVVRDRHGVLREATCSERDRMYQIFFPRLGRKIELPAVLLPVQLTKALELNRHVAVLDLVGVQCDPASEDYIRVHSTIYDDVQKNNKYHLLASTRYFGCLIWHLLTNHPTSHLKNMFTFLIATKNINSAVDILKLLVMCYPQSDTVQHVLNGAEESTTINHTHLEHFFLHMRWPPLARKIQGHEDSSEENIAAQ